MTGGVAIRGLSRHFGEVTALQGVDLDVEPGQIHALLGPNGAGKTTLLRILAGLTDPSAGEVMIDGRDVQSLGYRQRRKLFSLVPSGERTSYMRLSGFENLFFFARLYGIPRRAARSRAWECLSLVGLGEAGERRVGLYSQGMQKRLSIARGLLVNPPLLLIDEATQSLDPDGARTTRQLVREAAERGTAVIWTTQRLDEIRGFADRVTLLRQGEVRFRGTVAELSGTVVTKSFLLQVGQRGDLAPEEILRDLAEVAAAGAGHYRVRLRDGASLGNALAALVEHEIEILACREEVSDVEEAFMRLTTG